MAGSRPCRDPELTDRQQGSPHLRDLQRPRQIPPSLWAPGPPTHMCLATFRGHTLKCSNILNRKSTVCKETGHVEEFRIKPPSGQRSRFIMRANVPSVCPFHVPRVLWVMFWDGAYLGSHKGKEGVFLLFLKLFFKILPKPDDGPRAQCRGVGGAWLRVSFWSVPRGGRVKGSPGPTLQCGCDYV